MDRPIRVQQVIAHRGNGFGHPENTLQAVQAALEAGFWVEVDVRLSAQQTPHLMHDTTVDRTTRCTGRVDALSDNRLAECEVPTLEHVLRETTGMVEIDLKSSDTTLPVIALVARLNRSAGVIYYAPEGISLANQPSPVIWIVSSVASAKRVQSYMRKQDMFAIRVTDAWQNAKLVRYVTAHSKHLDIALQGSFLSGVRAIRGLPVTHVEVDDPKHWTRLDASPCMPELIYRASVVGIIIAFAVGVWAGGTGAQSQWEHL